MAKRTREQYEQVIKMAYDGYTADGIGSVTGRSASNISTMFCEIKLYFKDIRAAKREGKTLAEIMSAVDWSFLDKKAKNLASRPQNVKGKSKKLETSNQDIAEIKSMLTEIYEAMTSPKAAPSLMSKVANGVFRN